MRNALQWLKQSYNELLENVIRRCFVKVNCLPLSTKADANSEIFVTTPCEQDESVSELTDILSAIRLHNELSGDLGVEKSMTDEAFSNELADVDKDDPCGSCEVRNQDIMILMLSQNNDIVISDVGDDNKDDLSVVIERSIAINAVSTLRTYLPFCASEYVGCIENRYDLGNVLMKVQKLVSREKRL